MLDAAREATAFFKNKTRESLESDKQLVRALKSVSRLWGKPLFM